MPRIPTSGNASALGHVNQGNLRIGERLQYYRDGSEFGEGIERAGRAISAVGSAVVEFAEKKQRAEDNLAAAEYRAAWKKRELELEERMEANPGMVEEFGKWAEENDKAWDKESKVFTDRMSRDFRKAFVIDADVMRREAVSSRIRTSNRAAVKRLRNQYTTLIQELCQSGSYDDAVLQANVAAADGVFTNEEADYYREKYVPQMRDYQEVETLVKNAPAEAAKVLEDQNNYSNLTSDQRKTFLSIAYRRDAEKRLGENESLEARLLNGESVTEDEVRKNFEGRTSADDLKQMNQQLKMVQGFSAKRETAKERLAEAQKRKQFEQTSADLIDIKFSANANTAAKEYAERKRNILADFSGRGSDARRLIGYLDESYKVYLNSKTTKEQPAKTSYRDSYIYQYGKTVIDNIANRKIG